MPKLYALLVGIDDYPPGVRKLAGCVNDVKRYEKYLAKRFPAGGTGLQLELETLTDARATRDGVIGGFRSHLGKARGEDVVLFQFSGHGARSPAPPEFLEFAPDGKEEGLLCFDSRLPGNFDLADKELAILIAEVAATCPHITVILDCCHSGSGTRSADEIAGAVARFEKPAPYKREIGQYIDEFYLKQAKAGALSIPTGRHILLAGCERNQTAKERDGAGIFTSTIFEVLEKSEPEISYAELFVRARAAVRKQAADQDPQFEAFDNFNAQSGFLSNHSSRSKQWFRAFYDEGRWQVNCGAVQGAPTDPTRQVGFALYPVDAADDTPPAGSATTTRVGADKSDLALGFSPDPAIIEYRAEMTSLPVAPMLVAFDGPKAHRDALAETLAADGAAGFALVASDNPADYVIAAAATKTGDALLVSHRETGRIVQGVELEPAKPDVGTRDLVGILKHIAQWQRGLALQNLSTTMDPAKVEITYREQRAGGGTIDHPPGESVLEYRKVDGEWQPVHGKLRVRNLTDQELNIALVYFGPEYQVFPIGNVQLPVADVSAGEGGWMTLMGDGANEYFGLAEGVNESIETFKIIVSTERIDDFLLAQDALEIGKIIGSNRGAWQAAPAADKMVEKIRFKDEWFTSTLRLKVVRRLDVVGSSDASLANGGIVVKGHPSLKANLALTAATGSTRSVDDPDFFRAFQQHGMPMIDFAEGTRGANANVLELTDIENAETLATTPLQIAINLPLAADETILPLTFDGEFVRLGGEAYKQDDGSTIVIVDSLPDAPENARSLLGSLKLYFFKTVLKERNFNMLRWVDYSVAGGFERHKSGVADKVAAASNILLLVHGIIGDTEDMTAGIKASGVADKFDLVLTYDYENLNTPIEETAATLAQQLKGVGLGEGAGKGLTIVAHSMGGLVSRWFIEQSGGKAFVDHLVMCGTPNAGSPFGSVDGALAIIDMLADLSVNLMPAVVPFVTPVRAILKHTRAVTKTLGQMDPNNKFFLNLNASDDPGVRYTILAGNIDAYSETQDAFFGRLMVKAGRSGAFDLVFDHQPNDIAVGVESIQGVRGMRAIAVERHAVACHHLNYFASPAGRETLKKVCEPFVRGN